MMRRAEVLFELEQFRSIKLPNEVPDEADFGPTPRIYVEYNFSTKKPPSEVVFTGDFARSA